MILLLYLALALPPQPAGGAGSWLERAQQHLAKQEWDDAESAARKALEANPRLADAEVLLGFVAAARSQLGDAEKHLLRALELEPGNQRARSYLAATYLRQKRLDEAQRGFEEVLRADPRNTAAQYNLGLIGLLRSEPAAALTRFQRVLSTNAAGVPALLGALESRLLLGNGEAAGALARQLEAALPATDARLFQAATLLATHNEYPAAIRVLERMRTAAPDSYDIAYNLALADFRAGRYEAAAASLKPFLDPGRNAEAWNLFAAIEEKRGARDAVGAFAAAAKLEPGNEEYRFDEAAAVLQHDTAENGIAAFSRGVRDFPRSWRMHTGLGSALYLGGRYEAAAKVLLDAVALNPDAGTAYFLLGKAYESAASVQPRILTALRSYAARHPDAWAELHLGSILFARSQSGSPSDLQSAKQHLERALELNPALAEAHVALSAIAEAQGRLEESVRHLSRAAQIDPGLDTAHYRLGLAYRRLGDTERARTEMELFRNLKAQAAVRERNSVLHSLAR